MLDYARHVFWNTLRCFVIKIVLEPDWSTEQHLGSEWLVIGARASETIQSFISQESCEGIMQWLTTS